MLNGLVCQGLLNCSSCGEDMHGMLEVDVCEEQRLGCLIEVLILSALIEAPVRSAYARIVKSFATTPKKLDAGKHITIALRLIQGTVHEIFLVQS